MPAAKRPSDDPVDSPASSKLQRIDQLGDFSGNVKKKLAGSTRTGQACDRCKVRKIRCDARLGGCSPCLQNNTECKTTDRITGRATSRGHTENLESENQALRNYAAELQQQLKESGIEARPAPIVPQGYVPAGNSPSIASWPAAGVIPSWDIQSALLTEGDSHAAFRARGVSYPHFAQVDRGTSSGALLPAFRTGSMGENYLGVSSANDMLSPIKGTSLALFGMELDLADFMPSEQDPASSPLSYQTFLNLAFNKPSTTYTPPPPALNFSEVFTYAEWFLRSINPFAPILHKPDFMELLRKFANDPLFQPSSAETVMVHMVLAIIKFQYSARNSDDQARADSISHYHHALSFFPELVTGHTLQDMQALALICMHLRNFSRPGAAWMVTNMALTLAIELGLHRSVKAWHGFVSKDAHEAEMRKRVFWSLMAFHVSMSGKLGRPMPLHLEDFDVEMPEPVLDNLPSETDLSPWRKCTYRGGIQGYKLTLVMMQVYSTIYSIRPLNQPYEATVKQLEREIQMFQDQLPAELAGGSQTHAEDRILALYIQLYVQECRLLLHHPALCRSTAPHVIANNVDICLDATSKILDYSVQLSYLKSLDTTWYNSTLYLAAIFTTLFLHTERKDQITSAGLSKLKEDMDRWMIVLAEVGSLLGSGPRLQNACRNIIDFYVGEINRHLAAKTASAAVASADMSQSTSAPNVHQNSQHGQGFDHTITLNSGYTTAQNGTNGVDATSGASSAFGMDNQSVVDQTHGPYPSGNAFVYPEPPNSALPSYTSANMSFDGSAYQEDTKPDLSGHLTAHTVPLSAHSHQLQNQQLSQHGQQNSNQFLHAFQGPTSASNGFQTSQPHNMSAASMPPNNSSSGPAAWRHFTDNMMSNMGPQEYMTSANALMALGANKNDGVDIGAGSTMGNMNPGAVDISVESGQPWPLNTFNSYTGTPGGQ